MKLVISLGGSLIIPDKIDTVYLKKFTTLIQELAKRHQIVIVTGGGSIARTYMQAYQKVGKDDQMASWLGIKTTKLNATLLNSYFGRLERLPDAVQEIKFLLEEKNPVICGGLGFEPEMTSDATAAKVAKAIEADLFINLTNVNGLYTKDPRLSGSTLIKEISFEDFKDMANKIKYKPGQHFVLDQKAAEIISLHKIKTLILNGKKLDSLKNAIQKKPFTGTTIS